MSLNHCFQNILYLSLLLTLFLASASPFREYANRVEYVYDLWVNISILGEMFQNGLPDQKFGKHWFRVECDPGWNRKWLLCLGDFGRSVWEWMLLLTPRRPVQINYTICFWGRQGRDCLLMYCIQHSGASGFYFIIGVIQAARVTVCFWLNSWFLGLIWGVLFTQSQTEKSLLRARDSKSHQAAMSTLVLCEQGLDNRWKGASSHSHHHL